MFFNKFEKEVQKGFGVWGLGFGVWGLGFGRSEERRVGKEC